MAEPAEITEIAVHSVGIVGGRGAGKTVYLAALYRALGSQQDNTGFYLQAPFSQARRLIAMFATLAGHEWLPGTIRIHEWNFSLGVMASNKGYEACKFNYYDYGGELIDSADPDTEQQAENLAQKLTNCQAIIALLDGEKLSHFVTGEDRKKRDNFVTKDLPSIIELINPAIRSGNLRSLQFVITKWDYVQRTGESLEKIKELLLSLSHVRGLLNTVDTTRIMLEVQQTTAGASDPVRALPLIRLIPVSSVGFNFVQGHDPELGMVINANEQPEPWNVAYPLVERIRQMEPCE